MIELKEPKYNVGDMVQTKKLDGIFEIVEMITFNFFIDDYFYLIKHVDSEELFTINESNLKPYIEKPNSVWNLKEGDTYYSIYGNGNVSSEKKWFDDDYENNYREIGNAFLTKEEAEFEVERRKIETEMISLGGRRKFESNRDNYGIYYCDGINVTFSSCTMYQGLIYFDTRKEAEEAIKEIGKNRIKKYVFGVNK